MEKYIAFDVGETKVNRKGKKAKLHFDLVTLVYNASKVAVDRMNKLIESQQNQAA